jgi:hypothetical protein
MAPRNKDPKVTPEISAYMAAISGKGKGGRARAEALSAKKRKQIAQKAAAARWANKAVETVGTEPDEHTAGKGRIAKKIAGVGKRVSESRSEIAKKAVTAREAKRETTKKAK